MIPLNKQRKFLYIPFFNIIAIYLCVLKNSKYMIDNWRLYVIPYMFFGAVISIVPMMLLEQQIKKYFSHPITTFFVFYIVTLVCCISLMRGQKKCGIPDDK